MLRLLRALAFGRLLIPLTKLRLRRVDVVFFGNLHLEAIS